MTTEALSKELLDLLTCPVCKGKIIPSSDNKHVECSQCRIKYPVENGIPIILPPKKK